MILSPNSSKDMILAEMLRRQKNKVIHFDIIEYLELSIPLIQRLLKNSGKNLKMEQ